MKIDLSDAVVDDVVCATLKAHIKYTKRSIKELKAKKGKLYSHQEDDLCNDMQLLESMEHVYAYFGGNL